MSHGGDWRLPFNGAIGDRFTFIASMRTDAYYSDHVALTPNFTPVTNAYGTTIDLPNNRGTTSEWAGRVFPQAALKWRYPWVRVDGDRQRADRADRGASSPAPRARTPRASPTRTARASNSTR